VESATLVARSAIFVVRSATLVADSTANAARSATFVADSTTFIADSATSVVKAATKFLKPHSPAAFSPESSFVSAFKLTSVLDKSGTLVSCLQTLLKAV
jgi:hypothetical protein